MNRKPTALKILAGNPGGRPLPREPRPPAASTRCPHDLPEEARPYWRKLAPRLGALGLLTELDVPALKDLCLCLARQEQAEREISERGVIAVTERGLVKNPAVTVARMYRDSAMRLFARFGMTPSDRAGLNVTQEQPEDALTQFIASGRSSAVA